MAQHKPSLFQQGIGFISRGIDFIKRGFFNVAGRLVETTVGAWQRIWNNTTSLLKGVITGIKTLVVFSANIAVNKIKTTINAGKWIINTATRGVGWIFSSAWNAIASISKWVFTIVDITEVLKLTRLAHLFSKARGLLNRIGKFAWIGVAIGALDVLVHLKKFGLFDARFWTSLVETAGAFLAGKAVALLVMAKFAAVGIFVVPAGVLAAYVALGALAFGAGLLIGDFLGDRIQDYLDNNTPQQLPQPAEWSGDRSSPIESKPPAQSWLPQPNQKYIDAFADAPGKNWPELAKWRETSTGNVDKWGFIYNQSGNCVSYVAWRVNQLAKDAGHSKFDLTNSGLTKADGTSTSHRLGNADQWWPAPTGIPTSKKPSVGSVLVWDKGQGMAWSGGDDGHVAVVSKVQSDGSITIEESSWGTSVWRERTLVPAKDPKNPKPGEYPPQFINFLP